MDEQKRGRLEAAGWTIGSAEDFLGLSAEELAYIDLCLALSRMLKERRERAGLSKQALGKKLKVSASRVAKLEAGDPTATLDDLARALLAAGATPAEIGRALASGPQADPLRRAS